MSDGIFSHVEKAQMNFDEVDHMFCDVLFFYLYVRKPMCSKKRGTNFNRGACK